MLMEWCTSCICVMLLVCALCPPAPVMGTCNSPHVEECIPGAGGEGEGSCSFLDEYTTFQCSLVDAASGDYLAQLLSTRNACGFERYDIKVDLVEYATHPELCRNKPGVSYDNFTPVHTIDILSELDNPNCTKVKLEFCLKYMFRGCYLFTISPFIHSSSHRPVMHYVWIDNNFMLDDFSISPPVFKTVSLNPMEVTWSFKPGTFMDTTFIVGMKHNNDSNITVVTNNCTLFNHSVTCQFHDLKDGNYTLSFDIIDLWRCSSGDLYGACSWPSTLSKYKSFSLTPEYSFEIPVGRQLKYLDWVLVGALVVVFTLILIAVLRYKRFKSRSNANVPIEITNNKTKNDFRKYVRGILLLYARDCSTFMETMGELRKYLAARTKSKVYDIFDPNLFDEIATSPNEFIEAMLQDPHVNVIVISTECFEQLYQSMLQYFSHQSNEGKEASHLTQLYRTPHWLDGLVLHALKLISYDTSPTSYKKFFVVRLPKFNGLGNYLNHINPCTRFDLPGGVDTLIEKVSPPQHENGLMNCIESRESLHKALYNLNSFILSKPDYLYVDILRSKVECNAIS